MKRTFVKYSLLALLLVFANFTGCGVKGNPVVSSNVNVNVPIVKNFKADSTDNAIILNWDYYRKISGISYIAVEKSELGSAGNECKECPGTFKRIAKVLPENIRQNDEEYIKISLTDNKVMTGKTYDYRLLVCDDYNECREISATEIKLK
ncbi:MAG: hypothetical protein APR62_13175 [Smithella sp. SDB]|nr:MAG: hypothetical protein APR62_13175 [Smithella sp. SDB]